MFRFVTDLDETFRTVTEVVGDRAEVKRGFTVPIVRTRTVEGMNIPGASCASRPTSLPDQLGRAAAVRSRLDPRRAHRSRIHRKTGSTRRRRNLRANGAPFYLNDRIRRQGRYVINQLIRS